MDQPINRWAYKKGGTSLYWIQSYVTLESGEKRYTAYFWSHMMHSLSDSQDILLEEDIDYVVA